MPKENRNTPSGAHLIQRFCRNRRGAAAAEFALILPLFLSLMFGSMEFSMMFYTYNTMQTAARDAVRQVAVNSLTPSEATTKLKEKVPNWISKKMTVAITQTAPADPTTNIIKVNVSVPMNSATPITFFTTSTTTALTTQAEMKQELPFGKL